MTTLLLHIEIILVLAARMRGEPFDGELETLRDQLYGTHEMLCRAATRRPGALPPRTTYFKLPTSLTPMNTTAHGRGHSPTHPRIRMRQVMGTDRREAL